MVALIARLWWLVDRRALLVTAACFAAWRVLLQIPVVFVPAGFIDIHLQVFQGSGWFAAIGSHSLPMRTSSIGAIGLNPYINALIVVTLLRIVSQRVDQIAREPGGGVRLTRWIRALAVLLALGQGYGLTVLLQNQGALPSAMDWAARLAVCLQLAAGTIILMLVADVLDEHGLGYGKGALLLYALQPAGTDFHRLADGVASDPSFEALFQPFVIATVFAVLMTAGTVALWLGVRNVVIASDDGATRPDVIYLRVLASGVLRPILFAIAILFMPTILANYYTASGSPLADWIRLNWRPDGPEAWANVLYVLIWSLLIVGFAYFVTAFDLASLNVPAAAIRSLNRLWLIGGAGLALIAAVAPVVEEAATRAAGRAVWLSGTAVALGTVMLLLTIRRIERQRAGPELAISPRDLP